jgi:SecD/SecF fusion protein
VSSRRPHIILLLLILATLGAVFAFASPSSPLYKPPALGLDLKGGLQVVLKAKPTGGLPVTSQDLTRSVAIMRKRVDSLGVAEPDIRTQGKDQIVIDLPGVSDPQRALNLIKANAVLQLFDLEVKLVKDVSVNNFVPVPNKLFNLLNNPLIKGRVKGKASSYYLFNKSHHLASQQPFDNLKQLQRWQRENPSKTSKSDTLLAVPSTTALVSCDLTTSDGGCPGPNGGFTPKPKQTWWYLFSLPPDLGGKDLNGNGIRSEFGQNGPQVDLAFTGAGNKIFHTITANEWNRGRFLQTPQHFAVVLDGQLITMPQIDFTKSDLQGGIDPSIGGALIENIGSMSQANDIATVLQTGALPVRFDPIATNTISATLGQDSLRQAMIAAIVGLALVVVFLLTLYRFLGLVAVIGLGIYAVFLYGVILAFNVTLSLPGFAGMILTIGVAADANVVIFERIKEESRAGKSVKAAVATGYERGFHTIVDANVVTAITAAVLFLVATAGVKGFALMLLLGTGISLITAVGGTRAMLGLLSNFRWFNNPSFMGAHGAQRGRWLQIDFMRKRFLWLGISGLVVLVSASSLGLKGLNLGIDFRGGTQVAFTTPPTSLAKVRTIVGNVTGETSAPIQGINKTVGGSESYKSFQIRLRTPDRTVATNLRNQLESKLNAKITSEENVSPSFGADVRNSAIKALIVSFLLIMAYISLRFDFKFAVPVIVAVLHDIVITVGVYSLTGREVTTSTVAAVLTVLGYSVYDTIIIFDRVRENVPLMRTAPFARIANVSIWETIRRSLATTFITLLPVGALFVAGGATLKDFAFALLIGITAGAYSSIFVAAPLLTMWKEREPEYARRLNARDFQRVEREDPTGRALPQPAMAGAADQVTAPGIGIVPDAAKRERRRQRRRSRPHGRPR